MARVSVYRREHFNAAHRLNSAVLSEAENSTTYGKCNYPNYHGHNYELEVRVTGEINPVTGFVMDMKILSDLVRSEIHTRFDHRNLNLDTEEFRDRIPTAENIAIVIYNILREKIDMAHDLHIRLYETPRNWVEYPAN